MLWGYVREVREVTSSAGVMAFDTRMPRCWPGFCALLAF